MSDAQRQTTLMTVGTVTVSQRPTGALMKMTVRAAEATAESGLANLKAQCGATAQWLKRLGANRVDVGEPHFADQAPKNPLIPTVALPRPRGRRGDKAQANDPKREVCAVLVGRWDIAALSGEETLLLVDRLRFESADTMKTDETEGDDAATWASPEEQVRDMMMKQLERLQEAPAADTAPVILFISRLGSERLGTAFVDAVSLARDGAERLARATGMKLGDLRSIHSTVGGMTATRADKIMERQRCAALLAGCSYLLGDDEIVSDDPRSQEFTVTVHTTFALT